MRRQEFQRGPAAGPSGRHDDVGTVPANLELPGTRCADCTAPRAVRDTLCRSAILSHARGSCSGA